MREIVAAAIGIAITVAALLMLRDTYLVAKEPVVLTDPAQAQEAIKAASDAYGRQKDVLLLALTLFGTVTGYYLGRVPAELRAQQGERTAEAAGRQNALLASGIAGTANACRAATRLADTSQRAADAQGRALMKVHEIVRQASPNAHVSSTALSAQEAILQVRREIESVLRFTTDDDR